MHTEYIFVVPAGTLTFAKNDNGKQMLMEQVRTEEPESLKHQSKFPRRGVSSCLVERP